MRIFIDGIEVDEVLIYVNTGLNFGRFFDQEPKEYEIQLSKSEVITSLESDYNALRDEIKMDDQLYNDTSEFSTTNYMSLTELFDFESNFESIMKTYLDRTLYTKLFTESAKNQFVINSTDSIKVVGDSIIIKGHVFERDFSKERIK